MMKIIPTGTIMTKRANMKKLMIMIRSKRRALGGPLRRGRRLSRPVPASTNTRCFAADLLQVQPSATIDTIHDCRFRKPITARSVAEMTRLGAPRFRGLHRLGRRRKIVLRSIRERAHEAHRSACCRCCGGDGLAGRVRHAASGADDPGSPRAE